MSIEYLIEVSYLLDIELNDYSPESFDFYLPFIEKIRELGANFVITFDGGREKSINKYNVLAFGGFLGDDAIATDCSSLPDGVLMILKKCFERVSLSR